MMTVSPLHRSSPHSSLAGTTVRFSAKKNRMFALIPQFLTSLCTVSLKYQAGFASLFMMTAPTLLSIFPSAVGSAAASVKVQVNHSRTQRVLRFCVKRGFV
eukprot:4683203-Amphidinium_carterae.1